MLYKNMSKLDDKKRNDSFLELCNRVNTVKDIVEVALETYKGNPVFRYKDRNKIEQQKDKDEFYRDVANVESAFHVMFSKGSHIALLGRTSYEWLICYLGIMNSENVAIPLDKDLPSEELIDLVEFSDAVCILYDDSCLNKICCIKNVVSKNVKCICMQPTKDYEYLGDMARNISSQQAWKGTPRAADVAEIIFTSGTSGKRKGCMITHGNLAKNVINCTGLIQVTNQDRALSILPLSHAFEISAGILTPLCNGITICLNDSLKYLVPNMLNYKPTVMTVVPLVVETFYKNIWREIRRQKKLKRTKLAMGLIWGLYKCGIDVRRSVFAQIIQGLGGDLRVLVAGGAYMNPKIIKDFEKWGITILQGYGITECAPVISCNTEGLVKYNSVGRVVSGANVKIVDGEILVKGQIVMKGYYKNQQATNEAFEGEWFKTGDLGYLDSDNYLYITGRKKNLIILTNGENVSPEYLEQKVLQIYCVKEVVVSEMGGKIQAEVLLEEEFETANEQLLAEIAKLNKRLPDYMKISKVLLRNEEFKKTTTQKIIRN